MTYLSRILCKLTEKAQGAFIFIGSVGIVLNLLEQLGQLFAVLDDLFLGSQLLLLTWLQACLLQLLDLIAQQIQPAWRYTAA